MQRSEEETIKCSIPVQICTQTNYKQCGKYLRNNNGKFFHLILGIKAIKTVPSGEFSSLITLLFMIYGF